MSGLLGVADTLQRILDCVCKELADSGVPTCSCATTIGFPVVATPCECGPGVSGELWGSFLRLQRGNPTTLQNSTVQARPCAPVTWLAQYRISLYRCMPTITERGELPDPEELSAAADLAADDVAAITRAIHCCADLSEPVRLDAIDVLREPSGGVFELTAVAYAPVSIGRAANSR